MGLTDRVSLAWKALTRSDLRFPGGGFGFFDAIARPDTDEMKREVGDGTGSDLLMSTLGWIQRAALEAPPVAVGRDGEHAPGSKLQKLIDRPNPHYGFWALVWASIYELSVDGNAYWLPIRNANGRLAELWWAPSSSMSPEWPRTPTQEQLQSANGEAFISHYEYRPAGRKIDLDPEDVIHFRMGLDPRNMRKGLSPLRGLLREIWTDQEAADFTAGLLRRGAVPGVVISPKGSEDELEPEQIEAAKARLQTGHTRGSRGGVLGFTHPVNFEQFGFNPQQLDLSALRDIPEERLTAALGVSAAVVGFGAGLQTAKVGATMKELTRESYRNGVVPLWRILEEKMNAQVAPALQNGATGMRFDRSQVEGLQEGMDAKAARWDRLVRSGIATRADARADLNLEVRPADEVYLLPLSTVEVPANGAKALPRTILAKLLPDAKHHPSLSEQRIIDGAPRAKPTPAVLDFAKRMDRIRREAAKLFQPRLERVFRQMGSAFEVAARGELEKGLAVTETKSEDLLLSEAIMSAVEMSVLEQELRGAFESSYAEIASDVFGALERSFGDLVFQVTDEMQVEVLREGGTRAGLIDLDADTRDALFDALAEAREEGLAGDNLARRIRDHIEAGPWRDVQTRARVIARTEGAHAANTATIEAARGADDTEHMMVLDNRTGFDDPTCAAIDGTIVTIEEASALGLAHPNCTRSFTPVNALLMEEMGL